MINNITIIIYVYLIVVVNNSIMNIYVMIIVQNNIILNKRVDNVYQNVTKNNTLIMNKINNVIVHVDSILMMKNKLNIVQNLKMNVQSNIH